MNNNIKIALIDSGIDESVVSKYKDRIIKENDGNDELGHGTAIANIILNLIPDVMIHDFNIFDSENGIDVNRLIDTLEYIFEEKKDINIIHISSGVTFLDNDERDRLFNICKKFADTKRIIVSAFDNEGRVSYPACFEFCIGVDWCYEVSNGKDYIAVDNSMVDILGTGMVHNILWKNKRKMVAGSSFAAPYITAEVVKLYQNGVHDISKIKAGLHNKARRKIKIEKTRYPYKDEVFKIEKAITYPFNKEIDVLYRNTDQLCCELVGAYDDRIFGKVSGKVSDHVKSYNGDLIIKDLKVINWSDFDTVILGHLGKISSIKHKDMIKYFFDLCIEKQKNIFIFDVIDNYENEIALMKKNNLKVYSPNLKIDDNYNQTFGKLYGISVPVIGIMGTSPKQGKMTLQLKLKRKFTEKGYKLGMLGTEPNCELLGFDKSIPVGYGTDLCSDMDKITYVVNRYIHDIDMEKPDIIFFGSQSQTVPYNYGNLNFYTPMQTSLLQGSEPDSIVLVVNAFDDINYIQKTINFIESFTNANVTAIVISDFYRNMEWNVVGSEKILLDKDTLTEKQNEICQNICKPVFLMEDESIDNLVETLINYFGE